jgi:hypothetical protein
VPVPSAAVMVIVVAMVVMLMAIVAVVIAAMAPWPRCPSVLREGSLPDGRDGS